MTSEVNCEKNLQTNYEFKSTPSSSTEIINTESLPIPYVLIDNRFLNTNAFLEDDELPSEDLAIRKIVESSPFKRRKITKGKTTRVIDLSGQEFCKDESLKIPGEPVLACVNKKYYPAQIICYTEPDKYRVRLCYGWLRWISRKEFYTRYEEEFQTCQLGAIHMEDDEDQNHNDPELIKKVHNLEGKLYQVLIGMDESAWRYKHFVEGGKKRRLLAHKVSAGPYNKSEYTMVARVLRGMFVPKVAESIDRNNVISSPKKNREVKIFLQNDGTQPAFYRYSEELKLRFVNDVLLPEAIIRLIMEKEEINYEAAEDKMLTGNSEEEWVEDLLAERTSFQVGRESLREKA
ncbi:13175_t:CDS:2 [Acaulospora morrowiae]|uniref:13175_t:CDS:1 n=1 Tax=Acaulospora morrowiae TaxID=94023 RepID=A0A9N9FFZ4_9GLOM|nr:13175_t:CDS:2 [Acaulospora morrowiae]